jgi:perosamine synthetase
MTQSKSTHRGGDTLADTLAIKGGTPVRSSTLPYGRQEINSDDLKAVCDVLQSSWLTTGPKVDEFEKKLCEITSSLFCVAVTNGTAALHTAYAAIGIGKGDEVIVPAISFAATANAVLYAGGTPVFADVDPLTLLIDPESVAKKITSRTKAIVGVDYGGQPCDFDALRSLCDRKKIALVADACHSLGASFRVKPVGSLADLTILSFHPVKLITTGEGGAVVTSNETYAQRMKQFRNHGITTDHRTRERTCTWHYEMEELGYNYRLSDLQCALGVSQLSRLKGWILKRQKIAAKYDEYFKSCSMAKPLAVSSDVSHAYHLYVIQLVLERLSADRDLIFRSLRAEGIGVNVHYIPIYWHPYYERMGFQKGLCPRAEEAFSRVLTLPLYPSMTEADVGDVLTALTKVFKNYAR